MAAWQLTRNTDDAMDVSQEVFVRVYRALSSFKGNAKFSTWLHRIVLNTSVDFVRREKRHWDTEPRADSSNEDESPPVEPSIEPNQRETVYQGEIQRRVLAGLVKISARQRQVFLLRYYNELNLKEIADVLRCTEGAVKRHLFRAQERLRVILKDMKRP
jgi:RNA polymerase sigma-70 factor (ECF subfamily)